MIDRAGGRAQYPILMALGRPEMSSPCPTVRERRIPPGEGGVSQVGYVRDTGGRRNSVVARADTPGTKLSKGDFLMALVTLLLSVLVSLSLPLGSQAGSHRVAPLDAVRGGPMVHPYDAVGGGPMVVPPTH